MLGVIIGFLGVIVFAGSIPATSLAIEGFSPFHHFSTCAYCWDNWWCDPSGNAATFSTKAFENLADDRLLDCVFFPWMMALSLKEVGPAHGAVVLGLIPILSSSISVIITRTKPPLMFWIISALSGVIVTILLFTKVGQVLLWQIYSWLLARPQQRLGIILPQNCRKKCPHGKSLHGQ